MKLNHIYAAAVLLAGAGALSSCTPGQYWNEPGQSATVYAFPKPVETVSVDASAEVPAYIDVMVNRSNAGGAETVPVTFASSSTVLSGADEVTFEAGSRTATYRINIDPSADVMETYKATVTLTEPEDALVNVNAQNQTYTLSFTRTLTMEWQDAGTAACVSGWVGNDTPIQVKVQECVNWPKAGQHVIRLLQPYYVMEPEYAEPGYNITLTLDGDYNAVSMYSSWQYIGEQSGGEYFFLGTPASYNCSFTSEGNYYLIDGLMATGASRDATSFSLYAYETFQFIWNMQ